MSWIESHDNLGDHPKVYELCTALNVDKPTAIGVLHLLWHFTLKFSWRNGDLSKFSKESICAAIGWKGDSQVLFGALHDCGWLEDMIVHDWLEYAGKIVSDRLYNEKRKRRITPKNGVSSRKMTATLPNPTLPNLTNKDIVTKRAFTKPSIQEISVYAKGIGFHELNAQQFFDYYEAKGWVVGRSPMKDWQACIRTWKTNGYSNGGGNGKQYTGIKQRSGLDKAFDIARRQDGRRDEVGDLSVLFGGVDKAATVPRGN